MAMIEDLINALIMYVAGGILYLFGFVFLCSLAILAFLFGPRPPSDYYG